jgi:hypothetical protein
MSPSGQRRAINRSRKAFAFFSETGKSGTEKFYSHSPWKIQTEAIGRRVSYWDLSFIKFLR